MSKNDKIKDLDMNAVSQEIVELINQKFINASESFIKAMEQVATGLILLDKNIAQWENYFRIPIKETDDFIELRRKYTIVSNLIDECYQHKNVIKTAVKQIAIEKYLYDIFIGEKFAQEGLSAASAERRAKVYSADYATTSKISEMLLSAWEDFLKKLKDKLSVLQTLIYSSKNLYENSHAGLEVSD